MKNKFKRIIITTGALLMFTMAPITQNNPLGEYLNSMTTITAQAAEQSQLPYSIYWETQADGSWKYKLDAGGYAVNRWVQDEVDHNWYLLDDNGVMRTGVYKSYGKYYLLSEVHDGHYGLLVKNGEVYQGITISASTNADDEGALTDSTLSALRGAGVNVDNVQDVSGTTHTTGGQDVADGSGQSVDLSQEQSNNGGLTDLSSGAERIPLAPTDKSPIGTKRDGYTLVQWSSADEPYWDKDAVQGDYAGDLTPGGHWDFY